MLGKYFLYGLMFVSGAFFIVSPAHASLELVSYWSLDEASGTRVDSVGSNDLTPVNAPEVVTGYEGNAVRLPVASSSYLTIADNPSLSTTGSTSFKISLWVKLLSKSGTQVFVSKYDGTGQGEYAVYYEHTFQRFIFSTYSGGGGNHFIAANAFGEPQLDTWYFIEVTHDGLANTNTITINEEFTNILTGVSKHQDTGAAFHIGAFGAGPNYYAGAVIDEVRFYKAPVVPVPDNLVAYWKFDEGVGTVAVDTAYGDHNGTISGAVHSTNTPSEITFTNPYSLNFDGINDGVSTPLSLNNYPSFTLAGWAYPRSAANGEGWFGANDVFEFFFTGPNGVRCWTPRGEANWTFDPGTFMNRWHHITCLGTGSAVILYVDGQQVASTAHVPAANYGTGDNFSIGIGVQAGGSNGPFDGLIDDVRVYSRALSPQEMNSLGTGAEQPVNNPTITSLSPADNATTVSVTPTLVATFSTSTIATSTGSIALYTTSGNTLVETIPVTSTQIQKSGAVMTITPSVTLNEGTEYYVWIPGTAFKDGADLFYAGTAASTTWSFTTGDFTAPNLSAITATPTSTSATVAWTTNELASSKVVFGPTSDFGSTTPEYNTAPRVSSRTITLAPLAPCTQYFYVVVSRDSSSNAATSSVATFTTSGCDVSATPTAVTAATITTASGGTTTITDAGKSFTVSMPPNATATSSSVVIQVKAIPSDTVLATLGRPAAAPNEVGVTVFDVTAIIDNTTVLDSFDAEVTIDYEYTDEEVTGLNEATLWLYHYTGGQWKPLNDCTVTTATNKISCTTPSFSIFGLFGTSKTGQRVSTAVRFGCTDERASNYQAFSSHRQELCTYDTTPSVPSAPAPAGFCTQHITSYIRFGADNNPDDVRKLEQFLNEKQGEQLMVDGEYGAEDVAAVKRFQQKYASEVLGIWGITEPTGYVYRTTLLKINSFYCSAAVSCPAFIEHNSLTENNISAEVAKTKTLLSELGFYTGAITTSFDASLQSSLRSFQSTFKEAMLTPWGLTSGTGYKYKTTNKFLNMLVGCTTEAVDLDGMGTFDY